MQPGSSEIFLLASLVWVNEIQSPVVLDSRHHPNSCKSNWMSLLTIVYQDIWCSGNCPCVMYLSEFMLWQLLFFWLGEWTCSLFKTTTVSSFRLLAQLANLCYTSEVILVKIVRQALISRAQNDLCCNVRSPSGHECHSTWHSIHLPKTRVASENIAVEMNFL